MAMAMAMAMAMTMTMMLLMMMMMLLMFILVVCVFLVWMSAVACRSLSGRRRPGLVGRRRWRRPRPSV
jgi:hypothetical protein